MTVYRRVKKRIAAVIANPHAWAITVLFVVGLLFHYPKELLGVETDTLLAFLGLTRQAVERIFFLIPVTYAGMVFGLKTGLASLGLALVIILPRIVITHQFRIEETLETAAVIILGVLVNIWFERKRRENARYQQLAAQLADSEKRMGVSEQKYRYLFENASDAIWVQDVDGYFQDGNRAFQRLTGFAPEELRGVHLGTLLVDSSLARAREVRSRLMNGEMLQPYEQQFIVKDGSAKMVMMSTNAVIEDGRISGFEHVARDITREKQKEENVHAYIRQITIAQEEERKRVARDLHDDVSPELLMLIKKLDMLVDDKRLKLAQVKEKAEDLRQQAVRALEALRSCAQGLRPRIIDDIGLVAALEWIAEGLERDEDIHVEVRSSGIDRVLSPEFQIVLFRIVQEALNNVRKHAGATEVVITVTGGERGMTLTVKDNGAGFTVPERVEDNVKHGHLGLMGMDERARLLQGSFRIDSVPGGGTEITVFLPWQGDASL